MNPICVLMLASLTGLSWQPVTQDESSTLTTKEVVFEVPGITCVGRFKSSLQQAVVEKLDGVHSVNFQYLDRDPSAAQQRVMDDVSANGEWVFGGLGQLVFQVDQDFESATLVQRLVETRLYNTSRWVIVERTLLSDPRFSEGQ